MLSDAKCPLTPNVTKNERKMDTMQSEAVKLTMDIEAPVSSLSPVQRLPVEILGIIFTFATPPTINPLTKNALVDLCLVCQVWHRAMQLAPHIWASIALGVLPSGQRYIYENLISWFSRSGDYPKRLEFYAYQGDGVKQSICMAAARGVGVCLCCRGSICMIQEDDTVLRLLTGGPILQHFTFFGLQACYHRWIEAMQPRDQSLKPRPWDTLRSFELSLESRHRATDLWDHSLPTFRLIPPLVDSLHLEPISLSCLPDTGIRLDIPPSTLGRLTSLTLECNWNISHIFASLQLCRNLEILILDYSSGVRSPSVQEHRVLLPSLHTLRYNNGPWASMSVLQSLNTPVLQELQVSGGTPPSAKEIHDFLTQSGCTQTLQRLQVFSAHTFPMGDAFGSLISNLPSLSQLTFINWVITDNFLMKSQDRTATRRAEGERPFSRLQHMQLVNTTQQWRIDLPPIHRIFKERGHSAYPCLLTFMNKAEVQAGNAPKTYSPSQEPGYEEMRSSLKELGVSMRVLADG
ncbi:hypothetical protein DFP72DRAFT_901619 [Ephemerocybe angulata]|uniref:F-box domain-containing protein n=1 Tax=Ephemerocybe angulata TaxID=980116 RepID=A0A8H6M3P1_9AGAR|nr:hypothetical protein DFP72DRAFT_901619 [Tulosesus angulatus]